MNKKKEENMMSVSVYISQSSSVAANHFLIHIVLHQLLFEVNILIGRWVLVILQKYFLPHTENALKETCLFALARFLSYLV